MNVRTVVSGSVRKSADRLRIAAQLVNVADGFQIWSAKYDRTAEDVFAIQDEIATVIAERLKVTLSADANEPLVKRLENVEAYQLYLKGRTLYNRRQLAPALEELRRAAALAPDYAPTQSTMASALILRALHGFAPAYEEMPLARRAIQRALANDLENVDALTAQVYVAAMFDWDWSTVDDLLTPKQNLPGHVLSWRAAMLSQGLGRSEQAISEGQRAVALDPLAPSSHVGLQYALNQAGRHAETEATCRGSLELDPSFWMARRILGITLGQTGRHSEAVEELTRAAADADGLPMVLVDLIAAVDAAGQSRRAADMLDSLVAREQETYVQPTMVGLAFAVLRRLDDAFGWFERAYREHDAAIILINQYRLAADLRRDPRLRLLVTRVGQTPAEDLA